MATIRKRPGWRRRLAAAAFACLALPAVTVAADQSPAASAQDSLLSVWLGVPDATTVDWPYAYIAAKSSAEQASDGREALLDELSRLRWRLDDYGYPDLTQALDAWRTRITQYKTFRVPGDWSPQFLLSHPNRRPPIGNIASVGVCDVPSSVGVWSGHGYDSVPWHAGLTLSDVEKSIPATRQGSVPLVAVVDPYGHIDHYGVRSWNYADENLSPGSQVVASLALKGDAFQWIQDQLAAVLAHTPSGTNCRSIAINGESGRD